MFNSKNIFITTIISLILIAGITFRLYNLNIEIIETTAVEKIDRTLKSEKNLKVLIPNLELQIKEMKNYILN